MLVMSFLASRISCVLWATLAASVENLNDSGFGGGVLVFATTSNAFKNQFSRTKFSSSVVCTGGLKTEDRSLGRCNLLIRF